MAGDPLQQLWFQVRSKLRPASTASSRCCRLMRACGMLLVERGLQVLHCYVVLVRELRRESQQLMMQQQPQQLLASPADVEQRRWQLDLLQEVFAGGHLAPMGAHFFLGGPLSLWKGLWVDSKPLERAGAPCFSRLNACACRGPRLHGGSDWRHGGAGAAAQHCRGHHAAVRQRPMGRLQGEASSCRSSPLQLMRRV